MEMKPRALWLLVALLPGAAQAVGYFHVTNTPADPLVYDRSDPAANATYSRGYVAGVSDSTYGKAWCPPGKLSAEQTYGIVSKYLKEHPAKSKEDAAEVVTAALRTSFPCGNK
jgi:hypothetical protein